MTMAVLEEVCKNKNHSQDAYNVSISPSNVWYEKWHMVAECVF